MRGNLEFSGYMDAVSSSRSLLLTEEEQLEGITTISLETCSDLAEEDILSFIYDNFAQFLKTLRFLKEEDQELLLSYYILSKTQNTLAIIHKSTQTVCSFRIRMAIKTLGTFMLVGGQPTEDILREVFLLSGHEYTLGEKAPLSKVVMEYVKSRNFIHVAHLFGLHRPDVRRTMSKVSKALMDSKEGKEAAVAAWMHSLIDKVSPAGTGLSKRRLAKEGHLYLKDPEILGSFVVPITDSGFDALFTSRASR